MPFGFRIAPDTLPSGTFRAASLRSALAVSGFRLRARLDFSIAVCSPGQRGVTPAFGYGAPLLKLNSSSGSKHQGVSDLSTGPQHHSPRCAQTNENSSERRGDFNPHDSRAAQRTLRARPTPRLFPDSFVSSTSCRGPGSPERLRAKRGLPGSGVILSCVMGSSTTAERQRLAVTAPLILPSACVNDLGLCDLCLSRLNSPPHTIAVYASRRSSPSAPQHSLPSRRYPLPRLVFHQLDHASFPGALTHTWLHYSALPSTAPVAPERIDSASASVNAVARTRRVRAGPD